MSPPTWTLKMDPWYGEVILPSSSSATQTHRSCSRSTRRKPKIKQDMALFLLESGAEVDSTNSFGSTPFFMATEGLNKEICQLLIEWGADIQKRNRSNKTALDLMRHIELKDVLIKRYNEIKTWVPKVISGNTDVLKDVIQAHQWGKNKFACLRSRCLNGSTLLHTAAYFGAYDVTKLLLAERIDVNILDYRSATPLHRAKDIKTMELLVEAGAEISAVDADGNTALHIKCYGENGEPSELECLTKLIEKKVSLNTRNHKISNGLSIQTDQLNRPAKFGGDFQDLKSPKGLMPIHCCAMQGRIDSIELLLNADPKDSIRTSLSEEKESPASLPHLAVANNHLECASWLLEHNFPFKTSEPDTLVENLLMDKIPCSNYSKTIEFLISAGASANPLYPGRNTALHLAATQHHMTDVVELLLDKGADVDTTNGDMCSPLFFAAKSNNQFGASILLRHGADVRLRSWQGLTAFDLISDYDEWIESGYFSEEIVARLKAYSLKQARDLVRAISKKVKRVDLSTEEANIIHRPRSNPGKTHLRSQSLPALLPPIKR